MRPVTRGAWRSIRWLLLVVCAGGILAADDTWISATKFNFVRPSHWFSHTAASAEADVPAALNVPVEITPRARISMGGLLHGLLFDRPAGRWALDSRAPETQSSLARRLVEFDQIKQISGGDNFRRYTMPASFAPIVAAPRMAITTAELGRPLTAPRSWGLGTET